MTTFGYDKQRFPNLQGQIFDCIICSCVVKNPKQCTGCGNLFCGFCIEDWKKKNASCPNRCQGAINPMTSKALLGIYNDLDIKCEKGCNKILKLSDLSKHQQSCGRPRCFNVQICDGFQDKKYNKGTPVCSDKCDILLDLLNTQGKIPDMYKILSKYKPESVINVGGNLSLVKKGQSFSSSGNGQLKWDSGNCGTGIQFQSNFSKVFLKESAYVFRSAFTSYGFTSGIHYWEIHADPNTQNELKIGVTTNNVFDANTAFCDHSFGYAFYGLGQLRHGSNASGPQYGKRFKKEGVLGVYLNMEKGILAFSLNGSNMGIAYNDPGLTTGPIYPAVSLLHCAGCVIKGELPIPNQFQGL